MPARHDARVHADHEAQPLLGVADLHGRFGHLAFELVEAVLHDVEQELGLAVDVVIEAGLGDAERVGDVADRGGVVALLQDDRGRGAVDLGRSSVGRHGTALALDRHGLFYLPVGR